jgi:hypothetical protein
MTELGFSIKPLVVVFFLSVLIISMIISYCYVSQSFADSRGNNTHQKQAVQQQDFSTCVDNAMNKMLNGDLNFSDPDPISHCFNLLPKGNGNATNNNGGGNNDNNLTNNSTFSNV